MTRGLIVLFVGLAASLVVGTPAFGQSVLQVSVAANGTSSSVSPGGSVNLTASGLGQAVLATVTVRYNGTSAANITAVSFSGTSAMALAGTPPLPITLSPNGTTSFVVQYLPATGSSVTGLVSIGFTEGIQTTTQPALQPSVFTFTVNGITPNLGFTFFVLPNGALTGLTPGAQIIFPPTNLGSSASAVVNVLNTGSAEGSLQSVSATGADYQVISSTTPATVPAGQQVSFNVVFTPHAAVTSSGLLTVGLGSGSAIFSLSGLGTIPSLTVFYTLSDNNVHPLSDGTTISIPSVDVNGSTTVTINIANQGNGPGTVTSVSLTGAGFQLGGIPPLPLNVPGGQDLRFGIVFAPTQPGTYTGSLRITLGGSTITATLTGSTNPSNLAVSYTLADGNAHALSSGTTIGFPQVDVNTTTTATVTIVNQGTGAGTLNSILVTGTGFLLTGSPILPSNIPAGQNLHFGIVFAPTQAGSFTGTFAITVNGSTIFGTLNGSTNTPTLAVSYALADGIVHSLSNGAAIAFPSVDINATTTATITIVNQGTGTGTVTGISLAGSGFQLSGAPQTPFALPANQGVKFGIVFAPATAGSFTGTFSINLTGQSISGTLSASTATANFSLSYVDPGTSNILPLATNSTLKFPDTLAGATASIILMAANTGAGTGSINTITLDSAASGATSAFQLLSLPPLPLSVPPSQQLRFGVRFNPQQQQNSTDTLRVAFNGLTIVVNLQAQGTQAQYTYGLGNSTGTTLISAGGTVAMADTAVGKTSSVTISVNNFGTGDGQISTIGVTGQGLSLSNLPTTPFTLHPSASQQFTLNFAPTQPGAITGKLTIGSDTFTVAGTGIGPLLIYTYASAGSVISVTDGGTVIFPPLAVGSTENLTFSVQNTGTSSTTISSINLAAPSTVFPITQLPGLPMNLDPNASITFTIGFAPNNTGSLNATLRVNNSTFALSGNGTQPAPLPSYQFQGPANPQPAQQPTFGLTLASPYPLALQGTLTLTFVSSVFTDDPSIQFATGGRTVNFKIPANSTQALFNGTATSLALQTGTTAGNIVITPAFAMQGGFDLTPTSPAVLSFAIQRAAPLLQSASITSETLSSFTLVLTGYSTTRALTKLEIQVAPKSGQNFSTTQLSVDVSSAASSWFQGAASQGFGGSFLVAIPFSLSNGSTTSDLVHLLQSLSITAANDVGTSSAISVPIP